MMSALFYEIAPLIGFDEEKGSLLLCGLCIGYMLSVAALHQLASLELSTAAGLPVTKWGSDFMLSRKSAFVLAMMMLSVGM